MAGDSKDALDPREARDASDGVPSDQFAGRLAGLHRRFDTRRPDAGGALQFDMVKPFGPSLLETRLPDTVLTALLAASDAVLADATRKSWGRHLVGQIREEPHLSERQLAEAGVLDYLQAVLAEYVLGCMFCDSHPEYKSELTSARASRDFRNPVRVRIEAAWIVSQRAGEYNPLHNHSNAQLSSVIYLKVPEPLQTDHIADKAAIDGFIEFVDRGVHPSELQNASVRVKPEAGYFYVFPASLLHQVYAFRTPGERRSISINATYSY